MLTCHDMPERLKEAVISLKKEHVFRKTRHVFRIIEVSQRETHSVFCIFGRFCGSQVSVEACFSRRPLGHAAEMMGFDVGKDGKIHQTWSCFELSILTSRDFVCLALLGMSVFRPCTSLKITAWWNLMPDSDEGKVGVFAPNYTWAERRFGISLESACAKRWRSLIGSVNDPSFFWTTTSHWPCIPSTGVARNPNRLSLSRYWNLDLPRPGLFQKHPIWKNIHFGLEMVIFVESQFMSIQVNIMSIQ